MMRKGGFTLTELICTFAILGIAASIAIPGFIRWLPDYRLRNAARDLYSNMQLARMGAIRANVRWAVMFDPTVTPGRYFICSDPGGNGTWEGPAGDDTVEQIVDLSSYKSHVDYGHGKATGPIGSTFGNSITYNGDVLVFNARGTCNGGYVYLENAKKSAAYGVGTSTSGVVALRKWTGTGWE